MENHPEIKCLFFFRPFLPLGFTLYFPQVDNEKFRMGVVSLHTPAQPLCTMVVVTLTPNGKHEREDYSWFPRGVLSPYAAKITKNYKKQASLGNGLHLAVWSARGRWQEGSGMGWCRRDGQPATERSHSPQQKTKQSKAEIRRAIQLAGDGCKGLITSSSLPASNPNERTTKLSNTHRNRLGQCSW